MDESDPLRGLALSPDPRYLLYGLMGLVIVFFLGVLNFAAHKAVLESGHRLLSQAPWFFQPLGGRFSLVVEFVLLLGAMIAIAGGSAAWSWIYILYSALNVASAWLISSGRV